MRIDKSNIAAVALVLVAATTACEDLGLNGDAHPVAVSFAASTQAGLAATLQQAPPIEDGVNTLDLATLTLNLDEVVLERDEDEVDTDSDSEVGGEDAFGGDSDSEADSDSDGAGSEHFTTGPVSIDVEVDGGIVTAVSTQVPAGRYEELEMDFASIRFIGTFNDEAFDVTVPLDLELEVEFEPAIDVQDELSLTVALDVGAWFREADGSLVDPRALETDATLRNRLMQRIALALDAFEDSDRDGDDSDSDSD